MSLAVADPLGVNEIGIQPTSIANAPGALLGVCADQLSPRHAPDAVAEGGEADSRLPLQRPRNLSAADGWGRQVVETS